MIKKLIETKKKNILLLLLFAALFSVFLFLLIKSEHPYGGNDNFGHYKISRYSWDYPHLFLDHWGKPVFTLISSVFAQFGFFFMRLYNIIAGLVTAYLAYLIAKELNLKNPVLAIFFTIFAPIFAMLMITALTEITLSVFLLFSILLFFKRKYIFSAIIFSFVFFIRNESIVILPFYVIALIYEKKYKAIPFVFTTAIAYSIIGYFYYHDIFWLINEMPYTGAKDIYGSGSPFRFVKNFHKIGGIPLLSLFLIGLFQILKLFFKSGFKNRNNNLIILLIILPFITYFAAHSYVWWKGMGGSMGLIRVITSVVPLFSIISLIGFNFIIDKIKIQNVVGKIIKTILFVAVLSLIVYTPFAAFNLPTVKLKEYSLLKNASEIIKEENLIEDKKVFYHNAKFFVFLNLNPYNSNTNSYYYKAKEPHTVIPTGSIVIWDTHISPNEGSVPKTILMESGYFKLLKVIKSEKTYYFNKKNKTEFEILVFERVEYNENIDNYENYDELTVKCKL